MDPAAITAIAALISACKGWTIGTLIVMVVVLPPVIGLIAAVKVSNAMSDLKKEIETANKDNNTRFETVVASFEKTITDHAYKYDNNIYLVKNYEKIVGDMTGLVVLNTQATTRMGDKLEQLVNILNKK